MRTEIRAILAHEASSEDPLTSLLLANLLLDSRHRHVELLDLLARFGSRALGLVADDARKEDGRRTRGRTHALGRIVREGRRGETEAETDQDAEEDAEKASHG